MADIIDFTTARIQREDNTALHALAGAQRELRNQRVNAALSDSPPDYSAIDLDERKRRMNSNLQHERALFLAAEKATQAEKARCFKLFQSLLDGVDDKLCAQGCYTVADAIKLNVGKDFRALKQTEGVL